MTDPVAHIRRHWGTLRSLVPLAVLVASACTQAAPTQFTGGQPRTPVDKIAAGGEMKNFTLVGSNPLIDSKFNIPRGQNGGITAIRNCLYVGADTPMQPGLVLDMKDMTKPVVVGEVPTIKGLSLGREAIEGVADLNILTATTTQGNQKAYAPSQAEQNIVGLVYDVTDCTKPTIVAKINGLNTAVHYMNLWRDPKNTQRTLESFSYISAPDGVDIRVYDLTGCPKTCDPKMVAEWGLRAQLGIPNTVITKYDGGTQSLLTTAHDQTFSLDGRRLHVAELGYGYLQLDSSALAEGRTCIAKAATSANDPGHCLSVIPNFERLIPFGLQEGLTHGIVPIPGRPYVAITHEGYQCPYGGITFAYIGDTQVYTTFDKAAQQLVAGDGGSTGAFRADLHPRQIGMFSIPENQPDRCPKPGDQIPATSSATGIYGADILRDPKTVHDVIAFPSVMFASWYGGGLRAIDISNPATPFELGYFFNKPVAEVRWCSSQATACAEAEVDAEGVPVRQKQLSTDLLAKSYPISMNGYIVYSDTLSGVQVLKYTGPHAEEIPQQGICIAHNPSVVNAGFEPCAPYKTWSPAN